MTFKNFLGASSGRSTKDLLLDESSSESTISTITWAAATSRVWSFGVPDKRASQWLSNHRLSTVKTRIKYLQAWAVFNCSWSLAFSSSRLLICCFIAQSSRWCFRFASYSLFRAARDSSRHLAIIAFCWARVFQLSTVLYKACDFKKDRLATSYKCNARWVRCHQLLDISNISKRRFTLVYLKLHCI